MRELIAFLVWLAAAPDAIDSERPRAAAAVSVARASMVREAKGEPALVPVTEYGARDER